MDLNTTPRGLSKNNAAAYVGCGPTKFEEMVKAGIMPKPRLIGVKRVWDTIELNERFEDLPRAKTPNDEKNDWDE